MGKCFSKKSKFYDAKPKIIGNNEKGFLIAVQSNNKIYGYGMSERKESGHTIKSKGFWIDECLEGYGEIYDELRKELYCGQIFKRMKNGFGWNLFHDVDSFYEGFWQNDRQEYFGILKSKDELFQGEFRNGYCDGMGILTKISDEDPTKIEQYKGVFKDTSKEGKFVKTIWNEPLELINETNYLEKYFMQFQKNDIIPETFMFRMKNKGKYLPLYEVVQFPLDEASKAFSQPTIKSMIEGSYKDQNSFDFNQYLFCFQKIPGYNQFVKKTVIKNNKPKIILSYNGEEYYCKPFFINSPDIFKLFDFENYMYSLLDPENKEVDDLPQYFQLCKTKDFIFTKDSVPKEYFQESYENIGIEKQILRLMQFENIKETGAAQLLSTFLSSKVMSDDQLGLNIKWTFDQTLKIFKLMENYAFVHGNIRPKYIYLNNDDTLLLNLKLSNLITYDGHLLNRHTYFVNYGLILSNPNYVLKKNQIEKIKYIQFEGYFYPFEYDQEEIYYLPPNLQKAVLNPYSGVISHNVLKTDLFAFAVLLLEMGTTVVKDAELQRVTHELKNAKEIKNYVDVLRDINQYSNILLEETELIKLLKGEIQYFSQISDHLLSLKNEQNENQGIPNNQDAQHYQIPISQNQNEIIDASNEPVLQIKKDEFNSEEEKMLEEFKKEIEKENLQEIENQINRKEENEIEKTYNDKELDKEIDNLLNE